MNMPEVHWINLPIGEIQAGEKLEKKKHQDKAPDWWPGKSKAKRTANAVSGTIDEFHYTSCVAYATPSASAFN